MTPTKELVERLRRTKVYAVEDDRGLSDLLDFSASRLELLQQENERLREAILWANGEREDFPERKDGEGAFWWRKELMARAALKKEG